MLRFNKFLGSFWPAFLVRMEKGEKLDAFKASLKDYEIFFVENLAGADYLSGGSDPMMIDFHCYPIVERIVMIENSTWHEAFVHCEVKELAPQMYAYVHRFRAHPKMAPHVITPESYKRQMDIWATHEPGVKAQLSLPMLGVEDK